MTDPLEVLRPIQVEVGRLFFSPASAGFVLAGEQRWWRTD